jgi:heptaprenyl diphosphate synthase
MKKNEMIALCGMFVAVMMVLGYIESLLPLPGGYGFKIGLSNSVLLISLYWLGIPVSFILMLVKVLLGALMFASSKLIYALSGGILSMIAMTLMIYGVKGVSPIGAGIAGAVMHNVGQVLMAMIIIPSAGLTTLMAVLIVVGVVMGAITGTAAKLLMRHLPYARKKALGLSQDDSRSPGDAGAEHFK